MEASRILIIKPSSFGDIVHALPFLHVLRTGMPDAHIAWMVSRSCMNLLEEHPEIDELIVFERERWGGVRFAGRLHELAGFVRVIRSRKFDLVVDLQGLFRSGFFTGVSGAACRVGFANAREMSPVFYNTRVDVPDEEMHAVDRYLLVAHELGLDVSGIPRFVVGVTDADRAFAKNLLGRKNASGGPLIAILPASRWKTKEWPAGHFAALADRARVELGASVMLLGSAGDSELTSGIIDLMDENAVDFAGETTIRQTAALMELADVVVANDSGPMHLAVALGRPVVALYGPTSAVRTGPYGDDVRLLKSERDCAPCFRPQCNQGAECMKDIKVDDVFGAVRESLES